MESGNGEKQLEQTVIIKDRDGGNQINLNTNRQIAKQYLKALAMAH